MKLLKLIVILIFCNLDLFSQVFPKVEDYQIEGFENINFINVLLDAESSITNFYAITDDGKVYDINNMGLTPTTNLIFQINGDISEAFTYDSLHYLSLITNKNTYLIRTKNFIDIDTLYSEEGFEINDFQVYNNKISMIVNNGLISKIVFRRIDDTQWETLVVPEYGFNRIAILYDNYYLYKYLDNDVSIYKYTGKSKSWSKSEPWSNLENPFIQLKQYSELKTRDSIIFAMGKFEPRGYILIFDEFLEHPFRAWTSGSHDISIQHDFEFDQDFDFRKNPNDNYQIGSSLEGVKGAYLNLPYFDGNIEGNQYEYEYSSDLRKIISNGFSQYKEFVAVGHNGIVLLINRGLSDVETQIEKEDNFSLYPNPAIKKDEVTMNSIDVMKSITITDLMGKVLYLYSGINMLEFQIPINDLPSASYFVRIVTDKAVVSRRFNVVR